MEGIVVQFSILLIWTSKI